MSTMNREGLKIILPRIGPGTFWEQIRHHYAERDPRSWKYLAMIALQEDCGWTTEMIGHAFNHPKGHVTRCMKTIKQRLRTTFQLDFDDALEESEGTDDEHTHHTESQTAANSPTETGPLQSEDSPHARQ